MENEEIEQIQRDMTSPDARVRRAAVQRLARVPSGKKIIRTTDDPRSLAILRAALSDPDVTVQRSAGRALRPWVREQPGLFDEVLPEYATNTFNGTYTHAGLYDVFARRIWVPRVQAAQCHAALLAEGNTDRYFKFLFYMPGQAPPRLRQAVEGERWGHLVLHVIPEWSYARQRMVPEHDDRARAAALREQERYGDRVIRFYRQAKLPFPVAVHRRFEQNGRRSGYEYCIETL